MKLFIFLSLFSLNAFSWEAPEVLINACYTGCTPKMQAMYDKFLKLKTSPKFIPGMYSGECNHNSGSLNPDTTHYLGLLLDKDEDGIIVAPVLQFFGESNSMKDWSLDLARKEMSGDWKLQEIVKVHPTSLTAHIEDANGYPALVYWAKQDLKTKEIYFLAWMGNFSTALCIARPNVKGLPSL